MQTEAPGVSPPGRWRTLVLGLVPGDAHEDPLIEDVPPPQVTTELVLRRSARPTLWNCGVEAQPQIQLELAREIFTGVVLLVLQLHVSGAAVSEPCQVGRFKPQRLMRSDSFFLLSQQSKFSARSIVCLWD